MKRKLLYGFCVVLVLFLGALWFVRSRYCAYVFESRVMVPTIQTNTTVIVDKRAYSGATPKRFDIVAFPLPVHTNTICLSRIVGLPNEQIQLTGASLMLSSDSGTNTIPMQKYWGTNQIFEDPQRTLGVISPIRIPSNAVFVVGDNTTYALDSRGWGPLSLNQIIGRVKR